MHGHEVQQHSHQWWQTADTKGTVGEQEEVTVVQGHSGAFLQLPALFRGSWISGAKCGVCIFLSSVSTLFGIYLISSIKIAP